MSKTLSIEKFVDKPVSTVHTIEIWLSLIRRVEKTDGIFIGQISFAQLPVVIQWCSFSNKKRPWELGSYCAAGYSLAKGACNPVHLNQKTVRHVGNGRSLLGPDQVDVTVHMHYVIHCSSFETFSLDFLTRVWIQMYEFLGECADSNTDASPMIIFGEDCDFGRFALFLRTNKTDTFNNLAFRVWTAGSFYQSCFLAPNSFTGRHSYKVCSGPKSVRLEASYMNDHLAPYIPDFIGAGEGVLAWRTASCWKKIRTDQEARPNAPSSRCSRQATVSYLGRLVGCADRQVTRRISFISGRSRSLMVALNEVRGRLLSWEDYPQETAKASVFAC